MFLEIIPKKRDKEAKQIYLFFKWYIKQNHERMEKEIAERVQNYLLYGTPIKSD
jgi:hypothetical protein